MIPESNAAFHRLQADIAAVAAEPRPSARLIVPCSRDPRGVVSVAVLPGAFNPPTRAHEALLGKAAGLGLDAVLLALGTVTLDKAESGLALEDRLFLLERLAERERNAGVVLHNRGLYGEIAEALRESFPALRDLAFVVGMDKVPQLFDPRYYDDRERRLGALFERARFLVAPRGEQGREDLERLLARPDLRRFASRFQWLALPTRWRALSATRVREDLEHGEHVDDWLPAEVARFVRETGAFRKPGRYAARIAALRGDR